MSEPTTEAGRAHIATWDAYRAECKDAGVWEAADETLWAATRRAILAIEAEVVRDYLADPVTRDRLAAAIDMMFGGVGVGIAERCLREADALLAALAEPKP